MKIRLKPIMSVEDSDKLEGIMLSEAHVKKLFTEDVDLYCAESGMLLAKFRKKVIPANIQLLAFNNLLEAATSTDSRPVAGGKDDRDNKASRMRIRKNGSVSKQSIAKNFVNSGVAGYYDRTTRFPNCRLTAFTRHHLEEFKQAYPIIKFVDNAYSQLVPDKYKLQRAMADKTAKDFVIPGTSFTTVTVNKNYETAVHKDAGDFQKGFGNLVALRKGKYTGCHFVLPRWGAGFDMQNGDLLLVDVHQWHGNTPLIKHEREVTRLSLVMYYRQNMINCGTMEQELNRVKKRKKGEPLNEN